MGSHILWALVTHILGALGILTPLDPSGAREGSENSARTSDPQNDDSSRFSGSRTPKVTTVLGFEHLDWPKWGEHNQKKFPARQVPWGEQNQQKIPDLQK